MILSIRMIATENEDLTGAGMLWFKNLNEADPYLILPMIATALNYFNLGVSLTIIFCYLIFDKIYLSVERNYKRERALVCEPIQIRLPGAAVLTLAIHSCLASGRLDLLGREFGVRRDVADSNQAVLVPSEGQSSLLL